MTIVKDENNGFMTAADAAAADGKIFTARGAGHLANDTYTKNNGSTMYDNSEEVMKEHWDIQSGVSTSHDWKCSLYTFYSVNGFNDIRTGA